MIKCIKKVVKNIRRTDKFLLITGIIMFLFGLFAIFSASYVKAIDYLDNPYYYLIRQSIILSICFAVFLFFINIPTDFYKKTYKLILLFSIGALISLYYFGFVVNGARSWISFGRFNFQPSEFAKIAIILYLAAYYDKHKNNKEDYKVTLKPAIFVAAIFALIFFQPDLGSGIIFFAISALMFFKVPLYPIVKKKVIKIIAIGVVILGLGIGVFSALGLQGLYSYQLQRFNFLNPCQRYTSVGTGYQVCNGYIAINNGGLKGMGIGNSTQKYLYLPEAYTDFIFPIIVEEFGLIIGICLLLIYALMIIKILKIARKSSSLYGGLICYGVAMYMFIHIAVNFIGVLGLGPLTGVPLPFLSYGGSYALFLTFALTLVQRVKIENDNYAKEESIKNKIREV